MENKIEEYFKALKEHPLMIGGSLIGVEAVFLTLLALYYDIFSMKKILKFYKELTKEVYETGSSSLACYLEKFGQPTKDIDILIEVLFKLKSKLEEECLGPAPNPHFSKDSEGKYICNKCGFSPTELEIEHGRCPKCVGSAMRLILRKKFQQ